jgi:3-phenylpropionate/cinnamic acid dioxygenase small subunit
MQGETYVAAMPPVRGVWQPEGRRLRSSEPDHVAAVDFLTAESWRLDDYDLLGWLEMLDEDLRYVVPVRVTVGKREQDAFSAETGHYQDDYASMKMRVRRLNESRTTWAEDPPSRTRRLVSNIVCHATANGSALHVRSALIITRSRMDQFVPDVITAERRDVLSLTDRGLRLWRRVVLLDHTLLGTPNLAIFL